MRSKMTQVLSNEHLVGNVYRMRVAESEAGAKPGQFYMLGLDYPLLPRPLSICEIGDGSVTFCYAAVGQGTNTLAAMVEGEHLRLTGPLGNGFDTDTINAYKRVAIISGSVGVAPFVELAKRLTCEVDTFCGFASYSYLTQTLPNVKIATETGAEGHKGVVLDLVNVRDYDLVLACGSLGFSKTIIKTCREAQVPLLISLDAHMACGVGACLVCTCKTIEGNKRCCTDGPVFSGEVLSL